MLLHANKKSGPLQPIKHNPRLRAPAISFSKNRFKNGDSPTIKHNRSHPYVIDNLEVRCQGMKLNARDPKSPEKFKKKLSSKVSKVVTLGKQFSATINVPISSSFELKSSPLLPNIKRFSENPQEPRRQKAVVDIPANQILISYQPLYGDIPSKLAFYTKMQRYTGLHAYSEQITIPKAEGVLGSYGICELDQAKYYVSDLYLGYSFKNLLGEFGKFSQCTTAYFLRQLISTMSKLHAIGFIHNRLSIETILHNCQGRLFVNFFAASNAPIRESERQNHLHYFSPEMLASKKGYKSQKNDVWGIGCVALQFLSGKSIKTNRHHPYNNHSESQFKSSFLLQRLRERIKESWIEGAGDEFSQNAIDFISRCLQTDEDNRPTTKELLLHPFLQQIQQSYFLGV